MMEEGLIKHKTILDQTMDDEAPTVKSLFAQMKSLNKLNDLMFLACKNGSPQEVNSCIEKGSSVSALGYHALYIAAGSNNLPVLKFLIEEKKCPPEACRNEALDIALRSFSFPCVQYLLSFENVVDTMSNAKNFQNCEESIKDYSPQKLEKLLSSTSFGLVCLALNNHPLSCFIASENPKTAVVMCHFLIEHGCSKQVVETLVHELPSVLCNTKFYRIQCVDEMFPSLPFDIQENILSKVPTCYHTPSMQKQIIRHSLDDIVEQKQNASLSPSKKM